MNTSIESLTRNQIRKLISDSGLPKFRASQLLDWLYKKGVSSYEEMTNLPQSLRSQLAFEYPFNKPELIDRQISKDGTRKYLFRFDERRVAETVGLLFKPIWLRNGVRLLRHRASGLLGESSDWRDRRSNHSSSKRLLSTSFEYRCHGTR